MPPAAQSSRRANRSVSRPAGDSRLLSFQDGGKRLCLGDQAKAAEGNALLAVVLEIYRGGPLDEADGQVVDVGPKRVLQRNADGIYA